MSDASGPGEASHSSLESVTSAETSSSTSDQGADDVSLDTLPGQSCAGYPRSLPGPLIAESDADVAAFEGIRCIESELVMRLDVGDVTPLHSLEAVGWLRIYAVTELATLDGMNALVHVANDLNIGVYQTEGGCNGTSLETLSSLEALEEIGGSLYICANPNLSSVAALGTALTGDFAGNVEIYESPSLGSLAGLDGLTSVDTLGLGGLPQIASLLSLANLSEVSGSLGLSGLGISSMEGLEQVTSATSVLIIGNPQLASLAGLDGLASVEQNLSIHDNPMLPYEAAEAFAARIDVGRSVTICNNLGGPAC